MPSFFYAAHFPVFAGVTLVANIDVATKVAGRRIESCL
jgi:hypothetical protein